MLGVRACRLRHHALGCVDEIVRIDADALAHGGQGQRNSADLVGRVQVLNTIQNDEGGFAKHGD